MGNPIPSRDALIETIAEGLWAQARQKLLIPGHYLPRQRTDFRDEAAARQARFEAQIRADAYEQAAMIAATQSVHGIGQAAVRDAIATAIRALSDQPDSSNEGLAELLREIRREARVGKPGTAPLKSKWFHAPARLLHAIDARLSTGRQA